MFKKKLLQTAIMACCMAWACASPAEELWDPQLRGINVGLAAGALPPPGVYGVLDNYWAAFSKYDAGGHKMPGTGLSVLVEVPIVLWVPGVKFLGADYAVGIAQPFDYTSSGGLTGVAGSGNWGRYNTVLVPGQLSWKLQSDFYVKAGLLVYLDDAQSTMPDLLSGRLHNGGLPSGNGYAAAQPTLGVSWLHDGWNLSADFNYVVPISSDSAAGYLYHSAPEFIADYTVAKTFDKWTFGLGAHQQNQTGHDKLNGQIVPNSKVTNFGWGPLVEYKFSEVSILAMWNHDTNTKNDVGGDIFNLRLVVPL